MELEIIDIDDLGRGLARIDGKVCFINKALPNEIVKVKVTADNKGYNQDWITAPKEDALIKDQIIIPPHTIQNYRISLTLHGTGENQNEDQGKNFEGKIKVDIIR